MDKPRIMIVGPGLSGAGIVELMRAVAITAGYNIEFGGPGPAPVQPHSLSRHPADMLMSDRMYNGLLPLYLKGPVEHTYSQKSLTKRQKRRLRGKERNT